MQWTCQICGSKTDVEFDRCCGCKASRTALEAQDGSILLTTTPTLQTHEIIDYLGPVFGEAVMGANVFRDFFAGLSDLAGGRAAGYEQVLSDSRTVALNELRRQASTLGATAVVGLRIDYSTVNNSMLMVCCSGTAVYCEQLPREEGGSGAQKEI